MAAAHNHGWAAPAPYKEKAFRVVAGIDPSHVGADSISAREGTAAHNHGWAAPAPTKKAFRVVAGIDPHT